MQNEDFGIGATLGMPVAKAREQAKQMTGKYQVEVVSRDEMSQRAPYELHSSNRDRVLLIYQEQELPGDTQASQVAVDSLTEIRCYLADPVNSLIQLAGKPAARWTETDALQHYGAPAQRTETGDSETHLTYYFAIDGSPREMLQLVLSFHTGGMCFALALSLESRI